MRKFFAIGLFICVFLLGAAMSLQYFSNLNPCPLCVIERVLVAIIAIIYLIALIHNPRRLGQIFYLCSLICIASINFFISARHVWLQGLPPEKIPNCGPDLSYLLETLPIDEVLIFVLKGSGSCAEISWTFLKFSLAQWSLLSFGLLLIYNFLPFIIFRAPKT